MSSVELKQAYNSKDLENEKDNTNGSTADLEEGEPIDVYTPEKLQPRTKKFIIFVAWVAAMGGLIFGYDIAGAGATFVMDGFREHFKWDCPPGALDCVAATQSEIDRDKGLINGLFGLGATVGALVNPHFAETYGRRPTLSISVVVFMIGATVQAFAPFMWVMWLARMVAGMGIGMLSMCAPVFISECSPEHIRGALGTLWQLSITTGIVIASAANLGLKEWDEGWRLSYGGNVAFAIIMLICLSFLPESPRWLAAHGTEEEMRTALSKVRFEDEIDAEVKKLQHEVEEEIKLGEAPWKEVFSHHNNMNRRIMIGAGLFAIQQLCGINAVMFYAPDILNTFFSESQAIAGTFALNVINFLATFITVVYVDKFGRTKLLMAGGCIMLPCLILNGIFATLDQTIQVGYAVVVCSGFYIIGFAFSWGPILWILISEMYPYRTRGKAAGLSAMSNWIFTTIVGALFPVASTASLSSCFFFFAFFITIGMGVVYFYQVETAKLTSDEIDEAYENHVPALKRKDW